MKPTHTLPVLSEERTKTKWMQRAIRKAAEAGMSEPEILELTRQLIQERKGAAHDVYKRH